MTYNLLTALLLKYALAKPVWYSTQERRLGADLVYSHEDQNITDCVVGGYDDADPSLVYVGGPCSELSETGEATAYFRYTSMKTAHADIMDAQEEETVVLYPEWCHGDECSRIHTLETPNRYEVGAYLTFNFGVWPFTPYPNAGLFASTTSYLMRAENSYTTNDFVIGRNPDDSLKLFEACVVSCCASPPCDCPDEACPASGNTAFAGEYKYSLVAAAYDSGSEGGWGQIVEDLGEGDPKSLSGFFNVYQFIDFTSMNSESITLNGPLGSITYSDLGPCDITFIADCESHQIYSVSLEADDWEGVNMEFPQTYNKGEWLLRDDQTVYSKPSNTENVHITAVRLNSAWASALYGSSAQKVVVLRYKFDISGVTASFEEKGSLFVYDPVVRTRSNSRNNGGSGGNNAASLGKSPSVIALTISAIASLLSTTCL